MIAQSNWKSKNGYSDLPNLRVMQTNSTIHHGNRRGYNSSNTGSHSQPVLLSPQGIKTSNYLQKESMLKSVHASNSSNSNTYLPQLTSVQLSPNSSLSQFRKNLNKMSSNSTSVGMNGVHVLNSSNFNNNAHSISSSSAPSAPSSLYCLDNNHNNSLHTHQHLNHLNNFNINKTRVMKSNSEKLNNFAHQNDTNNNLTINSMVPVFKTSISSPQPSKKILPNISSIVSSLYSNPPILTEEGKLNLSGCTSLKGLKPSQPNWVNQDSCFIIEGIASSNNINSNKESLNFEDRLKIIQTSLEIMNFSLSNSVANTKKNPSKLLDFLMKYYEEEKNSIGSNNSILPNSYGIYGVFDGHGENGHHVSRKCKVLMPALILSNGFNSSSFQLMQDDLEYYNVEGARGKDTNLNASYIPLKMNVFCSGATGVVVEIIRNKIRVLNCGDSRVVLGRRINLQNLNTNESMNKYSIAQLNSNQLIQQYTSYVLLSNDHKPNEPEERKRIINYGGLLGCKQTIINRKKGINTPFDENTPVAGPIRVWYTHEGETLGLAMSRSLGDVAVHNQSGVICEPELIEHVIQNGDLDIAFSSSSTSSNKKNRQVTIDDFVILATDGVWDVVDSQTAVQLVYTFAARSIALHQSTSKNNEKETWSAAEASSCLAKLARTRWEKLSTMVDDITCIVVKLR